MYLGHCISKDGLQPATSKVEAIIKAPSPQNITELRAFLGLINYYGKCLSHLSTTVAPLHKLLAKGTKWEWGKPQQQAFDMVKLQLDSCKLLVHYDPDIQLVLSCDASSYGVGDMLAHYFDDSMERPIVFVPRTLAPVERRYSQLDKEALAIVFDLQKFHQYLFSRAFVIII